MCITIIVAVQPNINTTKIEGFYSWRRLWIKEQLGKSLIKKATSNRHLHFVKGVLQGKVAVQLINSAVKEQMKCKHERFRTIVRPVNLCLSTSERNTKRKSSKIAHNKFNKLHAYCALLFKADVVLVVTIANKYQSLKFHHPDNHPIN